MTYFLASTYGSGSFDTSTYNGATTSTGTASGGSLADTGTAVALFITVACVIIFVALVIRIWKRPRKAAPEA
jgi:hypothetical protein